MSTTETKRGRSKPAERESSSEDDHAGGDFSQSASGRYRSRVDEYADRAAWPSEPLYNVNEIVHVAVPGQQQPAGPYKIISSDYESATYMVEQLSNGRKLPNPVREADIRVPA